MSCSAGEPTLLSQWPAAIEAVATVVLAWFGWVQIHIARADRNERRQREADELSARAAYLSARLAILESMPYPELKGNMAALWTDDDERALVEAAGAGGSVTLLHAINGVRALHGLALHLQGVRVMFYEPGTKAAAQMLDANSWDRQVVIARQSLNRIVRIEIGGPADPGADTPPLVRL